MRILLDSSPLKIAEYSRRYGYAFGQLRTPLTRYERAPGVLYGVDNGGFTKFDERGWLRLCDQAESDRPLFVALPDIVGDAQRTIELFEHFKLRTNELPRALVLQDGIERVRIPWEDIDAVFIGGSDQFKCSPQAMGAARTAKILGRWVHVGRVNTAARVEAWLGLGDSIDGSGISRYDHMLEAVLATIMGPHRQLEIA